MGSETVELDSRRRLRTLLDVSNDLTRRLDLPVLLRRIVEVAVELVGARYGALGVLGVPGAHPRLEQFIHVGITTDVAAAIGHLPEGNGILGVLIDDATPVRLDRLSDDPRATGFPAHHPSMASFLGVPIRVGDTVFGNLYLTESTRGAFTAEDEELALALAATAGVAIENARLFEDAEFAATWSSELAEISKQLIQDGPDSVDTGQLVQRALELADADFAAVSLLAADFSSHTSEAAVGAGAEDYAAGLEDPEGSLAVVAVRAEESVLVDDVTVFPEFRSSAVLEQLRYGLVVPFRTTEDSAGVLVLARHRAAKPFRARDLEFGRAFSRHIVSAIESTASRERRRQLALLDERARIARDLHDHVIQRLFAVGLNLQATAGQLIDPTASKVNEQIAEIDAAIAQIRQSIFSLSAPSQTKSRVRARVLEAVDRFQGQVEQPVSARFLGPVDLMADAALTDDVVAVVTEGLSNAVHHASASRVSVAVAASDNSITVEVEDDGSGLPDDPSLRGLSNLRARAEARGGSLEFLRGAAGGTRLRWRVPLS